jgi:hypothetical protein
MKFDSNTILHAFDPIVSAVSAFGDVVTHSWPYVATAGAVAAAAWRWWGWFLDRVAYGISKKELKDQRDGARRDFLRSEIARTSMRAMVDDLTRSFEELTRSHDHQGRDLLEARQRLTEIDAMLETKTANEYVLFQDRERAIAWGRSLQTLLAAQGQQTIAEPEMLGVPVAEPEAVITERFMMAREGLLRSATSRSH